MKNRIDISVGRYWDRAWSLVDGCTPCSPGCDHCWSAGMAKRFDSDVTLKMRWIDEDTRKPMPPAFNGKIRTRPDRLDIPLRTRKPTVFAVWNDFYHESVPDDFQYRALEIMSSRECQHHTFLILTKRPQVALKLMQDSIDFAIPDHIYFGLTVCNQPEADEKIPIFLQVPGKKFLPIEPMLGAIDLTTKCLYPDFSCRHRQNKRGGLWCETPNGICEPLEKQIKPSIDAVILGGETGAGARPLHPDWVRSVRDQCAAAGVDFFFKGWGKTIPPLEDCFGNKELNPQGEEYAGIDRLLDGRTHDELPWVRT